MSRFVQPDKNVDSAVVPPASLFIPPNAKHSPLDAVLALRPALRGQSGSTPATGSSADVVVFADEVFKVARPQAPDFKQEIRILKHLGDRGLPVPKVTCVREDNALFGMTKTKGVSLSPELLGAMTTDEQRAIAEEIAGFMAEMARSFTGGDITAFGLRERIPKDAWGKPANPAGTLASLKEPRLQKNLGGRRNQVNRLVEEYMAALPAKERVVMHMDLNSGNIFIDQETKKLAGIIDMGEVGYVPPEQGFINLAKTYPKQFVEMVCDAYSKQTGQSVTYKDVATAGLARDIEPASRIYAGQEGGAQASNFLHKYVNIWADKLQIGKPCVKNHSVYRP